MLLQKACVEMKGDISRDSLYSKLVEIAVTHETCSPMQHGAASHCLSVNRKQMMVPQRCWAGEVAGGGVGGG